LAGLARPIERQALKFAGGRRHFDGDGSGLNGSGSASPQLGAAIKINDRQALAVEERRFDLD